MGFNVCIIPARGGSKGIVNKNIKNFGGMPLVSWSIDAALKAISIDEIIVSTDSTDVLNIAKDYGVEVHKRSEKNSHDDVHAIHAIIECLGYYNNANIDNVIMLLPTSPLRRPKDIDTAYNIYTTAKCDSLVSVVGCDFPLSNVRSFESNGLISPIVEVDSFEVQRQEIKNKFVLVNGSIYISTPGNIIRNKSFHSGNVAAYVMDKSRSIDINDACDWKLAEAML